MEDIGKSHDPCFRAALEGRRIPQHHAPSPDFTTASENYADGPMDAGSRCMNSTGSISDIVLLELGSTE